MAIKVVFPANTPSKMVAGLYQWDYGQVLEIECAELGSEIVEVHFACSGMAEAIVRPCTFSNGIGTVTIPDQCLEQTSSITAWIYKVNGTQGHTIKTIVMPVTARTRPSASRDVPAEHIDKYGELIAEVNEAINDLESGNVMVAKATTADTAVSANTAKNAQSASYATSAGRANAADTATKADTATSAGYATTAGRASTADSATKATKADTATSAGSATTAGTADRARAFMVSIDVPYCSITITDGSGHTDKNFDQGAYLVTYDIGGFVLSGVGYIGYNSGSLNSYSISLGKIAILYDENANETPPYAGGAEVSLLYCGENTDPVISNSGTLRFYKIGTVING